jgi:hydroxymethylbilane synthase
MTRAEAPRRIVIASRESALALWQARHVAARLAALYPRTEIGILGLTTEGDRRLDASLAKIGGKGLFIKELEEALLSGRADIAVHSVKDLPMTLAREFALAAVSEREDPRDAFVSGRHADLSAPPACAANASCGRGTRVCGSSPCAATSPPGCGSSTRATTMR